MAVKLNKTAETHAASLIKAGKVDKSSGGWSISADEENAILGNDNWTEYARWHLGEDASEGEKTKARYKYPFGKGGKVYRSALIAIRQRAGQQDATGIYEAAGRLVDQIDDAGKEDDNDADDKGSRLVQLELAAAPWALMPEVLGALANMIAAGVSAGSPAAARRPSAAPATAGIAIIPLHGVITQKPSWWGGGTSLDQFNAALSECADNPAVGQILVDIDSPGGSVYGVQESAALMQEVGAKKPVVAVANSLAASAAYWLGSSAGEFYMTPGGEVGSIGVWQAHMDVSQALRNAGVSPTLISAGKYKTEGNPYQPLDDNAREFMQSRVNDYYGAFVNAVASGRKVSATRVREGMGQGRVLGADAAMGEKMVDGVMTRDAVIAKMQRRAQRSTGSAARLALGLL